jgi:NAD(P)-dependent dehydrogenase (short-subunit alcohol dehydrogenase family)
MLIALVTVNVIHPGTILTGPRSELPSRKERRAARKAAAGRQSGRIGKKDALDAAWGCDEDGQYLRMDEV